MLKLTVLLITLLVIAKTGWTREKFSIQVNEGNTFGALVKAEPFTKINDGYYFFGTESLNWYEAYEKCRELNSELVTFETDQEFDAVTAFQRITADVLDIGKRSGQDWQPQMVHQWPAN